MDRKTVAIVVLTFTAMLLAGVVVQGLQEKAALAQSGPRSGNALTGRYSDYVMVPVRISDNHDALCVSDTITNRMLFFIYDQQRDGLVPFPKGFDLTRDFE